MREKRKIRTTGELRAFLTEMMVDVKSGELDTDRASRMTKIAAQVNESFYSEIKIARVMTEAGQTAAELGSLLISDGKEAAVS